MKGFSHAARPRSLSHALRNMSLDELLAGGTQAVYKLPRPYLMRQSLSCPVRKAISKRATACERHGGWSSVTRMTIVGCCLCSRRQPEVGKESAQLKNHGQVPSAAGPHHILHRSLYRASLFLTNTCGWRRTCILGRTRLFLRRKHPIPARWD